jgi:hypothetical protein
MKTGSGFGQQYRVIAEHSCSRTALFKCFIQNTFKKGLRVYLSAKPDLATTGRLV